MRRIRMQRLDIEDISPGMQIFSPPVVPLNTATGEVDWLCGHCNEILIHRAGRDTNEWVVLRCPHCLRFSRFREVQ